MGIFSKIFNEKEDDKEKEFIKNSDMIEIVILNVNDYDKTSVNIVEYLKTHEVVIVKFAADLDIKAQQRFIDFFHGSTSVLESKIYKITDLIYMISAKNINVKEIQNNKEKE